MLMVMPSAMFPPCSYGDSGRAAAVEAFYGYEALPVHGTPSRGNAAPFGGATRGPLAKREFQSRVKVADHGVGEH